MEHFLPYPTSDTFACGADALGRRNTRVQTDPTNTTCLRCLNSMDHAMALDPIATEDSDDSR